MKLIAPQTQIVIQAELAMRAFNESLRALEEASRMLDVLRAECQKQKLNNLVAIDLRNARIKLGSAMQEMPDVRELRHAVNYIQTTHIAITEAEDEP